MGNNASRSSAVVSDTYLVGDKKKMAGSLVQEVSSSKHLAPVYVLDSRKHLLFGKSARGGDSDDRDAYRRPKRNFGSFGVALLCNTTRAAGPPDFPTFYFVSKGEGQSAGSGHVAVTC